MSERGRYLTGWAISGLVVAFLLLDTAMKLALLRPVRDTLAQLGWRTDDATILGLGLGLGAATALYAWPRTGFIGAVLLTGYLGGAVATHARIGSPLATHTLFGVYVALLLWGGLYLRNPTLRTLVHGAWPQGRERMNYIDGFVVPVAAGTTSDDYAAFAGRMAGIVKEFGALRVVECWGDDVPDGTVTDFRRAVQSGDGETVAFSWIEWPDKATRDTGMGRMMADPRMQPGAEPVPFDMKRMIFGGFRAIVDA